MSLPSLLLVHVCAQPKVVPGQVCSNAEILTSDPAQKHCQITDVNPAQLVSLPVLQCWFLELNYSATSQRLIAAEKSVSVKLSDPQTLYSCFHFWPHWDNESLSLQFCSWCFTISACLEQEKIDISVMFVYRSVDYASCGSLEAKSWSSGLITARIPSKIIF